MKFTLFDMFCFLIDTMDESGVVLEGDMADMAEMLDMLDKYNRGLELFNNRDWEGARAMFRNGLKIIKEDGPCKKYIDYCTEYMGKPPPKNWDGVYRMTSK